MAGEQQGPHGFVLPVQDAGAAPAGTTALDRGSLAVFDLDRTLLPGSSLVALARALASSGMVTRRRLAIAAVQERRYRRRGSDDHAVDRLRDEALGHVAGLEHLPMVDLARAVAHRLCTFVSPGARHLLDRHLAAGDFVVVLSASPQELVEAVSAELGAHRGVGTRAEVVDGRYTGRLDGPFCYGAGKIDRLVADVGRVPLDRACAYADSASDVPLLQSCGHPVAVNPDRTLRRVARQRGWPVVRLA